MDLEALSDFNMVATHEGFGRASRATGRSKATLSRRVGELEQSLGVRLIERGSRSLRLTDEGRILHQNTVGLLSQIAEVGEAVVLGSATPRGRLRVSLPIIGYRFLLPVLPEFSARYPEIDLELDFNDRLVDVIEGGFDAAIRSGQLSDSQLMAKRLGPFRFVLCAAPRYLQHRGTPQVPGDLAEHACLRFRFPSSGKLQPWTFLDSSEDAMSAYPSALSCNNMEALRAATVNGMGIAYMPDFLVREDLESGALHSLLTNHLSQAGQFSVIWPSSKHLSPKLRAFVDFVSERLFAETVQQV